MEEKKKIKDFTDLIAWQEGHKLVIMVYKMTKDFPKEEQFGLTSQIQRASVSVTSCIAEGFSRGTAKDKTQFYRMSQGSLTELQNQLIIAKDLRYIYEHDYGTARAQTITVHKLISGLIKSLRGRLDT